MNDYINEKKTFNPKLNSIFLNFPKKNHEKNYYSEKEKINKKNVSMLKNLAYCYFFTETICFWNIKKSLIGFILLLIQKYIEKNIKNRKIKILFNQIIILYFQLIILSYFDEKSSKFYANFFLFIMTDIFVFSWIHFLISNFLNNFIMYYFCLGIYFKELIIFSIILSIIFYFKEKKYKTEWFLNRILVNNQNKIFGGILNEIPQSLFLVNKKKRILFSNENENTEKMKMHLLLLFKLVDFQNSFKDAFENFSITKNFNIKDNDRKFTYNVFFKKFIWNRIPSCLIFLNQDNSRNGNIKLKMYKNFLGHFDKSLEIMENDFIHWNNLLSLRV